MNPFLAQIASPPVFTPQELYAVMGVLLLILAILYVGKALFVRKPPLHQEFVTRDERVRAHAKMDDELGRERGARKQIHEQITLIVADIQGLKTETAAQTRSLGTLQSDIRATDARIDAIPARVIELLSKTKGLIP